MILRNMPLQISIFGFNASKIPTNKKLEEIKLASYIAIHSSFKAVDHLCDIYNELCKSKEVSDSIKLHRTKCTAIIKNVIAPSILENIIEDLGSSNYSLIIDESTDVSTDKYLCICIKYYSERENELSTNFLGMVNIDRATSQNIFDVIIEFLKSQNLDPTKIVGLATDGASNLCGCKSSVFTKIKNVAKNAILVKCICHSLHLCASKASEVFSDSIDFMLKSTYNWFSNSSLRKLKYKQIFNLINDGSTKRLEFIKLSDTRWLSRYKAVERILSNYLELQLFFEIACEKEKCHAAKLLSDAYKKKENKLVLLFLQPILKEIQTLNLYFQQDQVDFAKANLEIINFVKMLVQKLFKDSFLSNFKDDEGIFSYEKLFNFADHNIEECFLKDIDNINFGIEFLNELDMSKLTNHEIISLKISCKDFLKKLLEEVFKRIPCHFHVFQKVEYFSPAKCLSHIRPLFSELPLEFLETTNYAETEKEYENLLVLDWNTIFNGNIPTDSVIFWKKVCKIQRADGKYMFPLISKWAFTLFSLPHSNAFVERTFSIMNLIKTKTRNRMLLETLVSIMRIRFEMICKKQCCKTLKVTENMLSRFNSSIYAIKNNCTETEDEGETKEILDCILSESDFNEQ